MTHRGGRGEEVGVVMGVLGDFGWTHRGGRGEEVGVVMGVLGDIG